jgi:outer membrane biosynthesis protein TonB
MRALCRPAWILTVGLLVSSGACKSELDNVPAADPLDDPWVDAIGTGDESAAAGVAEPAAEPAEPAVDEALALAEPGVDEAEPTEPTEPSTDSDAGVVAVPTNGQPKSDSLAASKPAANQNPAANEPAAKVEPTEPTAPEPAPAEQAKPAPTPAAAEPAKPAAPPPLTIADFHGNYRYTGGSSQRKDLEQAIEASVMELAAVIRPIGRKRLTKTNPIDNSLDIVMTGDTVKTIFETGFDAACVIDGGTIHYAAKDGEKYKVRVRAKGVKLIQIIEGPDGVKTSVFVLSADKQRLTVHHKIEAPRLPKPLAYRLSYSRK